SNQTASEPRCLSAWLYACQLIVLQVGFGGLLVLPG
ncbi:hypothetical protein C8N38_1141, partial [Rhodovulum kholense]